ncbi:hypothetical protein Droror1_Dr00014522 [Drosera rotundifolia]
MEKTFRLFGVGILVGTNSLLDPRMLLSAKYNPSQTKIFVPSTLDADSSILASHHSVHDHESFVQPMRMIQEHRENIFLQEFSQSTRVIVSDIKKLEAATGEVEYNLFSFNMPLPSPPRGRSTSFKLMKSLMTKNCRRPMTNSFLPSTPMVLIPCLHWVLHIISQRALVSATKLDQPTSLLLHCHRCILQGAHTRFRQRAVQEESSLYSRFHLARKESKIR